MEVILVLPSASQFDMQLSDLVAQRAGAGFGDLSKIACSKKVVRQRRVGLLGWANEHKEAVDLRLEFAGIEC